MKKIILTVLALMICSNCYANANIVAAVIAANAAADNSGMNNNQSQSCTYLEGERYVIIAINNYSDNMTVYDKLNHSVFDFIYSDDGSRCNNGFMCNPKAKEVLDDVFGKL